MTDQHLKTPFGKAFQAAVARKANDRQQLVARRLPCTVAEVMGSGIVKVNFEVDATPVTLPQVVVAIGYPEYIRYPVQVGDKGYCAAADARLGAMTGLGSGVPKLSIPGNLTPLVFYWLGNKGWSDPLDPNAVEIYGVEDSGVILRSGDSTVKITLSADGIVIDTGGNDVTVQGSGDVNVVGGDVIADGISLKDHTHGGVETGGGDTGPPNP
jgi:hypothetical protein